MTKMEMRNLTNAICDEVYQDAMSESTTVKAKRLITCKAKVYSTANYFVLVSYNTVVAVIDKRVDVCYNVLRMVYGYTRTSEMHISKFCKEYGAGKRGVADILTYRG